MEAETKPLPLYPLIYGAAAMLLWLLPFFWSGWTKSSVPFLPKSVSFQYSAAGLFTNRSTRWWDHHLEVQAADDRRHELDERAVFPMGAFGYRTRYDRILNESHRSRMSGEIRQRLAEYVVGKMRMRGDEDVFSGVADMKALRLVRTVWLVGGEELAWPKGSWQPLPVTGVPGTQRLVLGTYRLVDGQVIEVPRKTEVPSIVQPSRQPSPPPSGGLLRPRLPVAVRPLPPRGVDSLDHVPREAK